MWNAPFRGIRILTFIEFLRLVHEQFVPDLGGRDQGGGGGGGVAVPLGRGRRHLAAEVDHLPEHAPRGDPLGDAVFFETEIFPLDLHLGEVLQPPVLVTRAGLQTQSPEVRHLVHLQNLINMNKIVRVCNT